MTVPVTLAILGASGDLAHRLLLPGLGTLLNTNPEYEVTLVGCAVDDLSQEEWQERVRGALGGKCPRASIEQVIATTRYEQLDLTNAEALRKLLDGLGDAPVLYLALPPAVTFQLCEALTTIELPKGLRLGLEKPFGSDLATARELNKILARLVPENQIFRIDHFLGKSVVLNLLGLRFTNRVFEHAWNNQNIERVEITVDEALALEGRAGYYDRAGAMRDMIQSHLLLVLALFAMEEPPSLNERDVRDLIALMLRHTHLWDDDPAASSRRARYTAGSLQGEQIPNYVDEPGVNPSRNTETLAEVTVRINTDRWFGVPFRLRSGKALGDARNGITVAFRPVDHVPEGFTQAPPNVLSIGMKPANIKLGLSTNAESNRFELNQSVLATDLAESPLKPYGEILDSIFRGDPLLTVRGDVAEECWRIVEPVLKAWQHGLVPMDEYIAGGAGPSNWKA
ncbi:glucose-6-phosphate dehydrogenase [Tessaracoccus oleiagri]|uniref:Glucose-6-phosphate 1-dehydrogenase n=1 Tax=Tessaracoccus oleiagri TaxID=686624 RepID=A0A1G9M9E2_9ACTN|nr:glucose-6-phosphate dehydrogenase [Tessaracoccus oleiagri]SDL70577.1 glucose-6-phosphate 1-dehydrogenase [Tessaracoccus oleiagri]